MKETIKIELSQFDRYLISQLIKALCDHQLSKEDIDLLNQFNGCARYNFINDCGDE